MCNNASSSPRDIQDTFFAQGEMTPLNITVAA
jgi:hypothetical protein